MVVCNARGHVQQHCIATCSSFIAYDMFTLSMFMSGCLGASTLVWGLLSYRTHLSVVTEADSIASCSLYLIRTRATFYHQLIRQVSCYAFRHTCHVSMGKISQLSKLKSADTLALLTAAAAVLLVSTQCL